MNTYSSTRSDAEVNLAEDEYAEDKYAHEYTEDSRTVIDSSPPSTQSSFEDDIAILAILLPQTKRDWTAKDGIAEVQASIVRHIANAASGSTEVPTEKDITEFFKQAKGDTIHWFSHTSRQKTCDAKDWEWFTKAHHSALEALKVPKGDHTTGRDDFDTSAIWRHINHLDQLAPGGKWTRRSIADATPE